MSRFNECFEHVVGIEGGYVNDSFDPGGETIYGITRRDHPGAWANGRPSLEAARSIYEEQYWRKAGCDRLPEPYDLLVFDTAVNQGIFPAVTLLQQALGVRPVDGRVGPVTIAACQTADKERPALMLAKRAARYAKTHGFERYGEGWLKRTYLIAMECK